MVLFTMFGVLMFLSDILFEFIPNVHGVALFICVVTLVYRWRAIIPVAIYVMITAVSSLLTGYTLWWIPYTYIFPILWLLVMLIPKKAPLRVKIVLSSVFMGLHGLAFGTLYAPFQMIMYDLSLEATLTWIALGFPFDLLHMVGNIAMSVLVYPIYRLLLKLDSKRPK